ncbi:hypothetical protein TEA_021360 [Camellia sinensis var. sinensis]|uniref:Carbonic anhydrase n=1 Tax=Camellia sinensis var. sinensis TaxID=542762 RepID=A0A4S4CY84_CAMSN|nr:hypothetical protein TEA_021360 [Camellia sinensis var. sinensis]
MADQLSNETIITGMKKLLRDDGDNESKEEIALRRIDVGSPVEIIRRGFLHFKATEFDKELAEGQKPQFLVFACSDSRVCPSRVLDFKPGQAFMARNIANLVPGFNKLRYSGVGAVIEYAVAALGVTIVPVSRPLTGYFTILLFDFIHDWIKIGLPAKAKVEAELPDAKDEEKYARCEREAVNLSLVNLLTYPYVQDRVAKGTLKLMGGHYDFVNGKFELWGVDLGIKPLLHI